MAPRMKDHDTKAKSHPSGRYLPEPSKGKACSKTKSGEEHWAGKTEGSARTLSTRPSSPIKVVSPPPTGRIKHLRERLDLPRKTFARLMSVSERSLASLEGGAAPSETVTRRTHELQRLVDALAEVIQPEAIGSWLLAPNAAFNSLKPIEVIERGEADRIWQMIFLLRSGAGF